MIRMKHLVSLMIFFTCMIGNTVTYESALNYSKQGNYEQAHKEFLKLAELGNKDAQFNLAVMHLKGQGKPKDYTQAYAWFKLAASKRNENYKQTLANISQKLDEKKLAQGESVYQELVKTYGDASVEKRFSPIQTGDKSKKRFRERLPLKKIPAIYPQSAINASKIGSVHVSFTVGRDGRVKHPSIQVTTDDIFIESSLKATKKFIYSPALIDGQPVESYGIRNHFKYVISGVGYKQDVLFDFLQDTRKNAVAGTSEDRYVFGALKSMFGSQLTNKQNRDLGTSSYWYAQSAIDGLPKAKFQLGSNLLRGEECDIDTNKSYFWLKQAAEDGHSQAQMMLGIERLHGVTLSKDEKEGLYWLKTASAQGYNPAKVEYAMTLATIGDKDLLNLSEAVKVIKSVKPSALEDRFSLFEAQVVIYSLIKNRIAYNKAMRRLLKEAKRLEFSKDIVKRNVKHLVNGEPVEPLMSL